MRLWHYSLIPYLPDSQLKGQWRECSLISVSLKKNNTPNHILVNRITDYGIDDYYTYCYFVEVEMNMRKFNITYKSKEKVYNSLFAFKRSDEPFELRVGVNGPIFSGWHNKEYLRVCMANLYEKYKFAKGKSKISGIEWKRLLEGYETITHEEYVV